MAAVAFLCAGCAESTPTADGGGKGRVVQHTLDPVFTDLVSYVDFSLAVMNDTETPVDYDVVSNSCSCTKSTLRQSRLLPGESTYLDARIGFHGEIGPKDVRITLREREGSNRSFDIHADCYRRISLPLNAVVSFGEVHAADVVERIIPIRTFAAPGAVPWRITSATCADDRIGISLEQGAVTTHPDGVTECGATLKIALEATPRGSKEVATVDLRANQGSEVLEEQLRIHWQTASVFSVTPPRVVFSVHPNDASARRDAVITVRRNDGRAFKVLSISEIDEAFQVEVSPQSESSTSCQIRVSPASPPPSHSVWNKLCIETDAEDQQDVCIPVAAVVLPEASP